MKIKSRIFLGIVALLCFACGEDKHPGNFIDTIKVYWDSDLLQEKRFVYHEDGKIDKIISKFSGVDQYQTSEFIYDNDFVTVKQGENIQHILTFEENQLTQYVLKQTFSSGGQRYDTIKFGYETGELKTLRYKNELLIIETDIEGNIVSVSDNGIFTRYEHDDRTNPLRKIPTNFFNEISQSEQSRELVLSNIFRFFNGNNVMALPVLQYEYLQGKVCKIVSVPTSFQTLPVATGKITERITYKGVLD